MSITLDTEVQNKPPEIAQEDRDAMSRINDMFADFGGESLVDTDDDIVETLLGNDKMGRREADPDELGDDEYDGRQATPEEIAAANRMKDGSVGKPADFGEDEEEDEEEEQGSEGAQTDGSPSSSEESDDATSSEEPGSSDPPEDARIEQIRNEIAAEYKQADELLKSESYQAILAIKQGLETDPVKFIDEFMPQTRDKLLERARIGVASTDEEQGAIGYATDYAERKLAEEFGADFEYDASQAAYKDSEHHRYFLKYQRLISEGQASYNQEIYRRQMEQVRSQKEIEDVAKSQLVAMGVSQENYDKVIEIAEKNLTTPAQYYEMLFSFLREKGLLAGILPGSAGKPSSQPTKKAAAPNPDPGRRAPAPGVHGAPSAKEGTRKRKEVMRDFSETFGATINLEGDLL